MCKIFVRTERTPTGAQSRCQSYPGYKSAPHHVNFDNEDKTQN